MQTLVAEILAAWRRAERLVDQYAEGTPEQAWSQEACDRLRDLYQAMTGSGVATPVDEATAKSLLAELDTS